MLLLLFRKGSGLVMKKGEIWQIKWDDALIKQVRLKEVEFGKKKNIMDSIYISNWDSLKFKCRATLKSLKMFQGLRNKDFYLPAHKAIFEAIVKLHSEDIPIDEDFVRNRVDKKM